MLPRTMQKTLPEMKAIVESFVGCGILVTQAKVSLQKNGLSGQLLKIKDHYECLVKLIEKMESAKYTIKEAVQAIQELDFGQETCNINQYIKKRMQNNDISEIINMEMEDISLAVYHMLQYSQPPTHICLCRKKLFRLEKTIGQGQKF